MPTRTPTAPSADDSKGTTLTTDGHWLSEFDVEPAPTYAELLAESRALLAESRAMRIAYDDRRRTSCVRIVIPPF
ncbi:MAG: hypothetical protein HRU00_17105 [Myxococcales bacterium]|nr:hypothetical protein [Myxococcales bacterium]